MHDLSEVNASRIIEGLEKMRAETSRAMGSRIERDLGEVDQMLIVFQQSRVKFSQLSTKMLVRHHHSS